MFTSSAHIYDAVYHWKDYAAESRKAHTIIGEHTFTRDNSLLDVACGTGGHIGHLKEWFDVEGLDLDEGLLEIARDRHPGTTFHHADMTRFDLSRAYGSIVCLFGSIGYTASVSAMRQAVANMKRHLTPGGALLVEPWIRAGDFVAGHLHGVYVDRDDLKISRMSLSTIAPGPENDISVMQFHYQVGTAEGIQQFEEEHRLGLFTQDDYLDAFAACGLTTTFMEEGLTSRGLFVATKPV